MLPGKLGDVLRTGQRLLGQRSLPAARLEAELLLADLLKWERHQLYLSMDRQLDGETCCQYEDYLNRRLKGEPVQYILGHREFMGLDFFVNNSVLIPRCDTETLVEYVLNAYSGHAHLRVLDLGTGSGAIAVSLAVYLKKAAIFAVDIKTDALLVAKENANRHGVAEGITFLEGDLFQPAERCGLFDIIVSNPPYIPTGDMADLMTEVRDYEPGWALDGGPDGLAFYRKIAAQAPRYLKQDGMLAMEVGYGQAEAVAAILTDTNSYKPAAVIPDMAGIDRVVAVFLKDR